MISCARLSSAAAALTITPAPDLSSLGWLVGSGCSLLMITSRGMCDSRRRDMTRVRGVRRAGVSTRRAGAGGLLAGAAIALALVVAPTASAASAPRFGAHGSVEQVYVTGLRPFTPMSLLNGRGRVLAKKRADSPGGLLFRNV